MSSTTDSSSSAVGSVETSEAPEAREATTAGGSADLRHGPLHDQHVALGATMAEFGGWLMPIDYESSTAEHNAVRTAVGLFDVSHLGKALVKGPGAKDFVNRCLANDLDRIAPGKAQYTLCCTEEGGVVDDLITYLVSEDEVFLVPNAANTAEVVRMLAAAAPEDIEITDQHTDYAVLAVQGPKSVDVLTALGLPTEMDYMAYEDAEVTLGNATLPVRVCRSGYTGEIGFELLPRWEDAPVLFERLRTEVTDRGGAVAGLGARDTLRTEMGYSLHGHELSVDINPVEARSGWAVGWDKPVFWGRDVLTAVRAEGPRRKIMGLKALDRGVLRPELNVFVDASESSTDASGDGESARIGVTTSGTFSPTLGCGIALALIDSEAGITPGDTVQVQVRRRRMRCEVVRPPFVETSTR